MSSSFDYHGAMAGTALPVPLSGAHIYMVGIKGTGMAALAEMMVASGVEVTGSDTSEKFYTDAILSSINATIREGFCAENIPDEVDVVIHSAAYDRTTHVELVAAGQRNLPLLTYAEALGQLSEHTYAVGIAGVHGKTTTTAMTAALVKALEMPGAALVGGAVADLGGRATITQGNQFLVAETDEYRRHFLHFHPDAIVVTSVEADHLDYFGDGADVEDAFTEFVLRLPSDGLLIYCVDDAGARSVAERVTSERSALTTIPYGEGAEGPGSVSGIELQDGNLRFCLDGVEYDIPIPGRHNALNAAAALLVAHHLYNRTADRPPDRFTPTVREALSRFAGSRRRSELIGEVGGVVVVDDYGHHPTAISATLRGYRAFYPGRRIVLDFMPHTYSRTAALLEGFAMALATADVVVLHDIYASAREENPGNVSGETLADATRRHTGDVHYVAHVLDALPLVERIVRSGDLFVTMGAGNNWQLGTALLERLRESEAAT